MPVGIVWASLLLVFIGYMMVVMVFRENSYTSRVVEVMKGQKVIDTGPYAVVRHPMYLGALVLYAFTPLALGSYWARAADVADHSDPHHPAHPQRGGSAASASCPGTRSTCRR